MSIAAPALITSVSENHWAHLHQEPLIVEQRIRLLLLLHPIGISLLDSFVYSAAIRALISKTMNSWLLLAMQKRMVTLLTRFNDRPDAAALRRRLIPENLGTVERDEMDLVESTLQGFSKNWRYADWHPDSGEAFKALISANLKVSVAEARELIGTDPDGLEFASQLPFLQAVIEGAENIARSAMDPKTGALGRSDLRHNELVLSFARATGVGEIRTVHQLLAGRSEFRGPHGVVISNRTAADFFAITGSLYDLNFSEGVGLSAERMDYSPWIEPFCRRSNSVMRRGVLAEDDRDHWFPVLLPSKEAILDMKEQEFISLLEGKAREEYSIAYTNFLSLGSNPPEERLISARDQLQQALERYCSAIITASRTRNLFHICAARIGDVKRSVTSAIRVDAKSSILRSIGIAAATFSKMIFDNGATDGAQLEVRVVEKSGSEATGLGIKMLAGLNRQHYRLGFRLDGRIGLDTNEPQNAVRF